MSRAVKNVSLHCRPLSWRALSTSTNSSLGPSSHEVSHELPPISRTNAGRKERGARSSVHPRMIFVRPWNGIPTMAHAFTIIRDIERRFGRIQEFVIIRDSDVLSQFSPFLHATFSRKEDADAIPLDGKVIQVAAPDVDKEREGGIGLDDLHVYLNPETRERALLDRESAPEKEPDWGPPEGKVMDVKLERTVLREPPEVLDQSFAFGRRGPPHLNNPIRIQELAHAIRAFGGFVDHPQGSQTRMEEIVSRWSKKIHQPRPDPVQENIAGEHPPEKLGVPTPPEENQWKPWKPFETKSEAPSPIPPSAPATPPDVTPMSSLPPNAPSATVSSTPPSQPKPTLEAVNDKRTPPPNLKPTPEPKSKLAPNPTPPEPKIPKKQRMLNAARLAGAMAAENPQDALAEPVGPHSQENASVQDAGAVQTGTELGRDPKASEEDNKLAARRWWNFFAGGN